MRMAALAAVVMEKEFLKLLGPEKNKEKRDNNKL